MAEGKKYSEILKVLKEIENGGTIASVAHGITDQTILPLA